MLFAFPTKRIGDMVWFLDAKDQRQHGKIIMFTIVGKLDECTVWYSIQVKELVHTVKESSIIEGDPQVPIPKYHIGDEVDFIFLGKDKEWHTAHGIVSRIEIAQWDDKEFDVSYYFDDDDNFWVMEDEVTKHHEAAVTTEFARASYGQYE